MTDYSKYKNFHILHNAEYGHLKSSIFDIQTIETSIFYVMKNMEIYTFIMNKSKIECLICIIFKAPHLT